MKNISLLAILLASISLSAQEAKYDQTPLLDSKIKTEVNEDNKQKHKEENHVDKNMYLKDSNKENYVDKRKELKNSKDYKKLEDYKKTQHNQYKSYNKYDEYEKGKIRTH